MSQGYKCPDSFRKFQELQNTVSARRKAEQIRKMEHDVLLNISKFASNPRVLSQTGDILEKEGSWTGTITLQIQAEFANDLRTIDLPVEASGAIPTQSILTSLFQKSKGMRQNLDEAIKTEVNQKLAGYSKTEEKPLKKEAASTPHAGNQFHEVIHVDKTWLPGTTKVGDILFVDGLKYRVTSGDFKKLSADSDGGNWTLERAYDCAESDAKPKVVGINL